MKFFKKRSVAVALCVILVLVTTLLNTRWKLGGKCRDLSESFYDRGGIAASLETIRTESDSLAAVAESNGIDAQALRTASGNLQGMLSQRSIGAAQLFPYYDALRTELRSIEQKLLSASLSDEDAAAVSKSIELIHSAQTAIGASEYNTQVRAFRSRNGGLFTRVLASLAGVRLPEEFA